MIQNEDNSFTSSSDKGEGLQLKFIKYTNEHRLALVAVYGNVMGTIILEDKNASCIENQGKLFQPILQSTTIFDISISDDEQLIAAYCSGREDHVSSCNYYQYYNLSIYCKYNKPSPITPTIL